MKTVNQALAAENAEHAVRQAQAFVDAGRAIPSAIVDLAKRACWNAEGRTAMRKLNPPRLLIAALERAGISFAATPARAGGGERCSSGPEPAPDSPSREAPGRVSHGGES